MYKSESVIQSEIKMWLEVNGYLTFRMAMGPVKSHKGYRSNPLRGWPDLFGFYPSRDGKMWAIECKTLKGKLSKGQMDMIEKLASYGVRVLVATSLEDVKEFFEDH